MSDPTSSARQPRPQVMLLAGLAVALVGLVLFVVLPALWPGGPAAPVIHAVASSAQSTVASRRDVVDVHLDRLKVTPPDPSDAARNPFRMGQAPAPPGTTVAHPTTAPLPAQPMAQVGPPGPPALPPIPYRFIGIVTGNGRTGKIAVLSDGRNVVSGAEGANIDGRYRIVRIGEESIQMEYADGRGRQTIRLSAQ